MKFIKKTDETLTKLLSDVFGVKQTPFKLIPVKLYRLGLYTIPSGYTADLKEYFIDEDGSLYSRNNSTYFTDYGSILTKLSDSSKSKSGEIVNSFRDLRGVKVTIMRRNLINDMRMGNLEEVTMQQLIDENNQDNNMVG